MKKVISLFLVSLLMLSTLLGCGGTSGTGNATGSTATAASTVTPTTPPSTETITLVTSRWAGPNADDQAAVLKDFTAETGIQVKQDAIDYGQLHQKQVLNMSSNTGAYDLVYLQEIWFPEYVKAGYLKPLDDYIKNKDLAGPDFSTDNYIQSFMKIDTSDGKLYALPTFAQADLLAYNTDMITKAGCSRQS